MGKSCVCCQGIIDPTCVPINECKEWQVDLFHTPKSVFDPTPIDSFVNIKSSANAIEISLDLSNGINDLYRGTLIYSRPPVQNTFRRLYFPFDIYVFDRSNILFSRYIGPPYIFNIAYLYIQKLLLLKKGIYKITCMGNARLAYAQRWCYRQNINEYSLCNNKIYRDIQSLDRLGSLDAFPELLSATRIGDGPFNPNIYYPYSVPNAVNILSYGEFIISIPKETSVLIDFIPSFSLYASEIKYNQIGTGEVREFKNPSITTSIFSISGNDINCKRNDMAIWKRINTDLSFTAKVFLKCGTEFSSKQELSS